MATPNFTSITSPGSVSDLFKHFDFGHSTYRGDSPVMSFYQYLTPLLGSRVMDQLLYGNKLEGQKQTQVDNFLRLLQPGNVEASADRMRSKGVNAALSQSPQNDFAMRAMGLGTGARAGAMQAGINQANTNANSFMSRMNSPEGKASLAQAALAVIGQGQQSDLPMFNNMASLQMGNDQFRMQNRGKGSLGATLGGLAGMFAGGKMPGLNFLGGAPPGGGSDASSEFGLSEVTTAGGKPWWMK